MSAAIRSRDDLSFTKRDDAGRLINWPRYNYGVPGDWEKGIACFDVEIAELATHDETEAFHAIQFAIVGMGGRCTSLETGFIDRVARAAVIGLRSLRAGAEQFAPTDVD
ncbi:hypothetical protein [Pseudomonas sp. CH235]|uniref:hypothetical protein n=1 Tax=Pseudomonas sp. CH235 TaxID=1634006 RepID=UPI001063A05E|nr:hypothetical protein [Pseudomonas sp. CH235]TEA58543.1 hypothetical protein EIY71_27415 [Pseudomonas sp. CH235]